MWTIAAFSESEITTGVFQRLAAVSDQHMHTEDDNIMVSEYNKLFGALACISTTGEQARFVAPSLRRINPEYITPVCLLLYPTGFFPLPVYPEKMLSLDINEMLQVERISTNNPGVQETIIVWLAKDPITPATGKIRTIRISITGALVAGEWVYADIDFIDELPVGQYDIVGFKAEIDVAVAARFSFVGGVNRPGVPCMKDLNDQELEIFRMGRVGLYGSFTTNQPPGVELIGSADAGSATYYGFLDIIAR